MIVRKAIASLTIGALASLAFISRAAADGTFEDGNAARLRGDYATAVRIWQPLAEKGDKDAENGMGVLCGLGQGVPLDYNQAIKWYRLAMQHGSIKAEYNLALAYRDGHGVPADPQAALRYLVLAANDGLPQAQGYLGDEYYHGNLGLAVDYAKAFKYYRASAIQGYAEGQEGLGILYAYGLGVPEDHVTAYAWLTLAYDDAPVGAKPDIDVELYSLLRRTAGGQVAEARRLAVRCRESHYQDCADPENPPI